MKSRYKTNYLIFDKHFIIITTLALGTLITLSVLTQRTQTQQQASHITDLNTSDEIETANNPDGTMGPKTMKENFSTELPTAYLGTISVNLSEDHNSSPQTDLLSITIDKIELHLIHLFIPGSKNQVYSENQTNPSNQKTNQNVNKWETLNFNNNTNPIDINFSNETNNFLGTANIAGGKYSEIRFYISKASIKSPDGKITELTIPGNFAIIRLFKPFNIFAGKSTDLSLKIDQKRSIIPTGDKLLFIPVITNFTSAN